MTDVLWPTGIYPSSQEWGHVDNVGVFQSQLAGATRTISRTGARMSCKIVTPMLKGQDRARMQAFIAALRGKSNRAYIPDFSNTQRGSFPATELLTNGDFSNGTTGWSTDNATISVTDGALVFKMSSGAATYPDMYQSVALTQYAPHVLRSFLVDGAGSSGLNIGPAIVDAVANNSSRTTARGLISTAYVAESGVAANQYPLWVLSTSGYTASAFLTLGWCSLSRCIIADNGPNALTYSDQLDNAAWTKTATTITANGSTAPDGTATADRIVETTATSGHFIGQSMTAAAAAADYLIEGAFQIGNGRNFVELVMTESTTPSNVSQFFNLSTGAVGSSGTTGAGWSNRRAFIQSLGNGWYYCALVARKTTASTSITNSAFIGSADGTDSYTGSTSNYLNAWRIGAAQSSVPTRLSQVVASALVTGTTQTGSGIYVKGLPASTSGLLKLGDRIERSGQINTLTANLDSDAAGLGYLQCGNPWKSAVADNDPIIVKTPMSKMILASDDISYDTGPGQFSAFQLEFIEDVT